MYSVLEIYPEFGREWLEHYLMLLNLKEFYFYFGKMKVQECLLTGNNSALN